jgi:hypothetical protein
MPGRPGLDGLPGKIFKNDLLSLLSTLIIIIQ